MDLNGKKMLLINIKEQHATVDDLYKFRFFKDELEYLLELIKQDIEKEEQKSKPIQSFKV